MGGNERNTIPEAFWGDYRAVLDRHRVSGEAAAWHVKRAQQFVWRRDLTTLRALPPEEVCSYFRRVLLPSALEEWQISQVVDAVSFLCRDTLRLPWAAEFPWSRWKQPPSAMTVTAQHDTHPSEPQAEAAATSKTESIVPRGEASRSPEARFSDAMSEEAVRRFPQHFERLRAEIRTRHYSFRTEEAYAGWLARFVGFRQWQSPDALGGAEVRSYLEYLATVRRISASTQSQALCALVFFFGHVLHRPLAEIGEFTRAKRPIVLPTVLSREEIRRIEPQMSGTHALMAGLLYGSGLRLMECVRLRVKDLDFDHHQIVVRDGKGQKDRVTVMPEKHREALQAHLRRVRALFESDLQAGLRGVYIWPALRRKYPSAPRDWVWQYVFPSANLSKVSAVSGI